MILLCYYIIDSRFVPILCNLTKQKDIENLHIQVLNITKTLHGLVNNAGVGVFGPVDWVSMDDYRNVMELNFFAGVNLVKLFMPNFVSNSRIVNVTSMYIFNFKYILIKGLVKFQEL